MTRFDGEDGATMVEYGFLLAGIAIVVALVLPALATAVSAMFDSATGYF